MSENTYIITTVPEILSFLKGRTLTDGNGLTVQLRDDGLLIKVINTNTTSDEERYNYLKDKLGIKFTQYPTTAEEKEMKSYIIDFITKRKEKNINLTINIMQCNHCIICLKTNLPRVEYFTKMRISDNVKTYVAIRRFCNFVASFRSNSICNLITNYLRGLNKIEVVYYYHLMRSSCEYFNVFVI